MSTVELGLLVVGGTAVAAQLGHAVFKRLRPRAYDKDEIALAAQFVSVLATLNSLLLAFMAVSVWDSFKAADASALNEATAVAMLGRDLGSYTGTQAPVAKVARGKLREYGRCVVDDEWPLLARGESNPKCLDTLNELFLDVAEIDPKTMRGQVVLGEIWARVNEISRYRRERLQSSRSSVPFVLWLAVLTGTVMTLGAAFLLPRTAFGRMMILMLSVGFGIVFFFIIDMDKPFTGADRVQPDALTRVLRNMDRFDQLASARRLAAK
jgi:hypothetical protein